MSKAELRSAADLLRAILARVEAGELTAPGGVVARFEDAQGSRAFAYPALGCRE
jgi:hypothetical protein